MAARLVLLVAAISLGQLPDTLMADEKISDAVLVIHGGAGVLSHELRKADDEREYRAGLA